MKKVETFGFSENFIERLADLIISEHPGLTDLSRVCVVFGGKRPQLFLKKALGERIKANFFPPQCFAMDDFMRYIAGKKRPFRPADDLHACFLLYTLASRTLPALLENRESFSRFLAWAREILNFIEQLDLEDVPEGQLREIEISASIGYEVPESVNSLLRNITLLRKDFHSALSGDGALTRGMAYRDAARAVSREAFAEFDRVYFCNFYFLHGTEQAVIRNLFARDKATLVFQRDGRSWSVLERMEHELGVAITAESRQHQEPSLSLYSAFDTHSQVGCVRSILASTPPDERTVIVLPDPDALIPLLSGIADCCGEFNVSLGYPVTRTSLYSLFKLIFQAQSSRKPHGYYARDYLRTLGHPLVKNLCLLPGADPVVTRVLVHKVEETLTGIIGSDVSGKLFIMPSEVEACPELLRLSRQSLSTMGIKITVEELAALLSRLHRLLFGEWEDCRDFRSFCTAARELVGVILDKSPVESYPLNLLVCQKIYELLSLLENGGFDAQPFGREEIFRVFLNDLERRTVSFSGSPLKGLQVLGLFETRCLNFDTVIVLDLNEKALPNLSVYEPLIPREIMLSLGLNRIEKEDEIQRYQFFRLIGGAKHCHLVFSDAPEKEKSRFLEELLWERQKKEGSAEVAIPKAAFAVASRPGTHGAAKTPQMLAYLKERLYSASSLNTYLQCPMRFYFQYVLGLQEKTDLLDETEAKDIGTFCHDLLEDSFKPFLGGAPAIDTQFRARFFALFEERFSAMFERTMRSDAFMLKEVLSLRLKNFLEKEAQRDVRQILSLEREEKASIALECGSFAFTYRTDRVDRLGDSSLLVIDYKTGGADVKPASFATITAKGLERRQMKKTLKSFQLPMYLYFTRARFPGEAANAALYSLRNAALTPLLKPDALDDGETSDKVFLACLQSLLAELTDPATPFTFDRESPQYCGMCPFTSLCR